jgi:hypothetical protein
MISRRIRTISFLFSLLVVAGCGAGEASAANPIQTCTAQNIAGYPYSGTLCSGWGVDGCSAGLLYHCAGGARLTQNNCTLMTSCNVGCLSGSGDTPVTANVPNPVANDTCFTGSPPLTASPSTVVGGSNVTFIATLPTHTAPYAIVNLQQLGPAIAQPCNVPLIVPPGVNTTTISLPTAVVMSPAQAAPWALISYNDSSGHNRNLVSLGQSLTIGSGGSLIIPPLASFVLDDTNGNPISTITGGSSVLANATLSSPAPFGGVNITLASNPASAFAINLNPSIPAGCISTTDLQSSGSLTATSSATSNMSATVTATDGSGSPLSQNVTITAPSLTIGNVILNPTSVNGGSALTATVTLDRAVSSSDPSSTVSVRVSEGEPSGVQVATFSGCAGSPACTGPLTIPVGASSASMTITTSAVASQQFVTVAASATWSQVSASANFVVNASSCTPNTCSGLGFNCGSASDACGGTLSCGTCSNGQTCTNNVCTGSGIGAALTSLTLNPTSVKGGDSSTGSVTLSAAAPSGGGVVTLTSSKTSVATVPSSVTVPAGKTSANFTVSTQRVSSNTDVVISGTYAGGSKSATLTATGRSH